MKTYLTVSVILMFFWLGSASAQLTETKLVPTGGRMGECFGYSVTSDGNHLIIGAPNRSAPNMWYYGYVYTYENIGGTWTEQSHLVASDSSEYACFGWSVSIDGDYLLIGAYQDPENGFLAGAAYIFKRSSSTGKWIEQQKLLASDGDEYDWFGYSVSLWQDYALIGAPRDSSTGSAYIFRYIDGNWTEVAKLVPPNGIGTQQVFGASVSLNGNYAIIGAPSDEALGNHYGAAYIYYRDSTIWIQQAKLHAANLDLNRYFGHSVSLSGDYAVIGSPWAWTSAGGAAFVFHRTDTTWTEEAVLEGYSDYPECYFGWSVSIDGDYVVVGARKDRPYGPNSGSAYIFKRSGTNWMLEHKLVASDGHEDDEFGNSVFIEGDQALVGAFLQYTGGLLCGATYVYNGFVTGIPEPDNSSLPENFSLEQNYPNPFNPTTTIEFSLPHVSRITLHVYDVAGRKVKTLVDGNLPAGKHTVQWDGTNDAGQPVASGVYLYRLQAGSNTAVRKMVLLR